MSITIGIKLNKCNLEVIFLTFAYYANVLNIG